jgi:hypothetical protein
LLYIERIFLRFFAGIAGKSGRSWQKVANRKQKGG